MKDPVSFHPSVLCIISRPRCPPSTSLCLVAASSRPKVSQAPFDTQSVSPLTMSRAHLPALAKLEERSKLRAIWSRSSGSAQKASTAWRSLTGADDIDVYSETGQSSGKLEALLADTAIHAVIIALPITSQPDIILKALRAGKHVLSEKPVGASVEDARKLVRTYEAEFRPRGQVRRPCVT